MNSGGYEGSDSLEFQHPFTVSFPTWDETNRMIENSSNILDVLESSFSCQFLHGSIERLCDVLADKYAKENESCLCFPSYKVARRCREFIHFKSAEKQMVIPKVRILQLATSKPITIEEARWKKECKIAVVFVEKEYFEFVKKYWQITGEIISSRLAEYVLHELFIVEKSSKIGGNSSGGGSTTKDLQEARDKEEYIETRFGRSLNFSFGDEAKTMVKRRIATKIANNLELYSNEQDQLTLQDDFEFPEEALINLPTNIDSNSNEIETSTMMVESTIPAEPIDVETVHDEQRSQDNLMMSFDRLSGISGANLRITPEKDVYLFPSRMAALFTAHRLLLNLDARRVLRSKSSANVNPANNENESGRNTPINRNKAVGFGDPYKKTVMFGFSNCDTVNLLQEFNHMYFFCNGDSTSLKELEKTVASGEQILAVFVEAPSCPLLKMADIIQLRTLANLYGFYLVIDETIGGFVNIDVLPYADIICSSLSKIFSGDLNVAAGAMILNPQEKLYTFAQTFMNQQGEYEDHLWCEDAIYLERNSRDYVSRTMKINRSTIFLLNRLLIPNCGPQGIFKNIYYPSLTSEESRKNYDAIRCKYIQKDENEENSYGGVFSLSFNNPNQAAAFFDNLKIKKGSSIGATYTIACPYAMISNYKSSESVANCKVDENLVRVTVGLEDQNCLLKIFSEAVDIASKV